MIEAAREIARSAPFGIVQFRGERLSLCRDRVARDDGRPAEIFLGNGKAGSTTDTAARDSAVVASIALQHGVPLETIRRALLRDSLGRPSGPLGAALDLLAAEQPA